MKIALAILAVLLVLGLLLGSSFVGRRNQMAIKREAVSSAWSQVDVVLQRRADLIPNLVETVKGFAAQEQAVFGDIAKARSALLGATTPTDKIAANQRLDSALGRLLVVVENYPTRELEFADECDTMVTLVIGRGGRPKPRKLSGLEAEQDRLLNDLIASR